MSSSTVLITGAAGFIGSHLAQSLLEQGHRVVGLDNFNDFYDPSVKRRTAAELSRQSAFTLVEADLRDRPTMLQVFATHKPSHTVHLAAMAGVRPSIENPALYSAVNIEGLVNLLDAVRGCGCRHVQFASSSSVYGNNPKVPFAEEDNVDHPISPYAATKKAGELIAHTYAHLFGMSIHCLRFFTVFGPRQRPDLAISKFLHLLSTGKEVPMFGDGSTSRDYTFVRDIVTGIRASMRRCEEVGGYRVYNLGGNHPVSLREMIATIERVVGRSAKIKQLPMQQGDVERTWADLTRSRSELGYEPGTTLEAGIAEQWAWMRQQP